MSEKGGEGTLAKIAEASSGRTGVGEERRRLAKYSWYSRSSAGEEKGGAISTVEGTISGTSGGAISGGAKSAGGGGGTIGVVAVEEEAEGLVDETKNDMS